MKWGKFYQPTKKDVRLSTPDEIADFLEHLWAVQVWFFEGRQKNVCWKRRAQQSASLKLFAPTQWPFTSQATHSAVTIPLGAFPVKREQAGYKSKNGISRDGITAPLTNFCLKCFTRGPITKHTEGGFVPERGELVRKFPAEHEKGFYRAKGEGLDNRWVTKRIFTRQEVRYGFNVPQIHACGERAEA